MAMNEAELRMAFESVLRRLQQYDYEAREDRIHSPEVRIHSLTS